MAKDIAKDIQEEDFSVELTDKEKSELEAEARREVVKQLKESKKKAFKEQAKVKAQSEQLFRSAQDEKGEDLVEVQLTLASHPKYIMLDGKVYHSRPKPYKVTKAVASVLIDQMQRGWDQEAARMPNESGEIQKHMREFRLGKNGLKQVA